MSLDQVSVIEFKLPSRPVGEGADVRSDRPVAIILRAKTRTYLVVNKVDVLLLGTRTLDVLGESKDTDEEDGSASSEDGRRSTFLGADVEVWVMVANTAGSSPLLLGSDGVVLWSEEMLMSEE